MPELTSIERARELILERCEPLAAEPVPLAEALGRVLAEPRHRDERVPGFDNSAMDGFAFRARRPRTGRACCASPASRAPVTRTWARSGRARRSRSRPAPCFPDGADAVVRVEDTSEPEQGSCRRCRSSPSGGANVRRAGDDIEPGAELLGRGDAARAAELGVLASVGVAEPSCARRPARRPAQHRRRAGRRRGAAAGGRRPQLELLRAARPGRGGGRRVLALARPRARRSRATSRPRRRGARGRRRARRLRRRLGRPARPRQGRLRRARRRAGLLARLAEARQAGLLRVAPDGTLVLRAAGQPGLRLRHLPALRAAGAARAAGQPTPARARIEAELTSAYEKPADRAHAIRVGSSWAPPAGWRRRRRTRART